MSSARVLITGAGGPSGYSLLVGFQERGHDWELHAADIDPNAAGLYVVPAAQRVMLPRGDDPSFSQVLLDVCAERGIDVLVPTVDSELLVVAERKDEFEAVGTKLVLASVETLETCLDKWRLQQACEGHVRVPRCVVAEADFDPTAIELPAFVKPRSGSGSRGIALITEISGLERLPRDGTMLVQENLPGPEYSLDVLADRDGRVLAVVPRERMKVDSGIAVTAQTVHDPTLERFGRTVAERIGLNGVANVQAKGTADGEPALLEVNARFPGTMPLTVASGVDMPGLCVREALGEPMPAGELDFEPMAMVRLMREHYMDISEIEAMRDEQAQVAERAAALRSSGSTS
jgi:carbamoyl-phosphate synthase large subunit